MASARVALPSLSRQEDRALFNWACGDYSTGGGREVSALFGDM